MICKQKAAKNVYLLENKALEAVYNSNNNNNNKLFILHLVKQYKIIWHAGQNKITEIKFDTNDTDQKLPIIFIAIISN